jgi:prepilin-type N-terminal cleavage/methylation domain-containing protein
VNTTAPTSRTRPGFTLIELLVVVAVILVLAGILLAGLTRSVGTARRTSAERSIEALVLGINQFKADFGFLPPLVHDGRSISGGSNNLRPVPAPGESRVDGPVLRRSPPGLRTFDQLVVWSEADPAYLDFMRRRNSNNGDAIALPQGGSWDLATAWDDRRYSKFALPYYLSGVGGAELDAVEGPGMSRPLSTGLFEGIYFRAARVGTVRDRYDPVIEADRASLRLVIGYLGREDYTEHGVAVPNLTDVPDSHVAFMDPWGRAFRYYRWEPGRRLANGRLVVENTLDLNIPPVLINPEVYEAVQNQDGSANARDIDLTSGNAELRAARYAVVSAGPDGLFGTETIEQIAAGLRVPVPSADSEHVRLRKLAWEDNLVGLGN